MIRASIMIVTHGQRALTERCLESLAAALGDRLGVDWEVIVVDNCSPDDTPVLLRQWSDRIRVELLDHNRNFAGGSNLGAELAEGTALVFLNNDTVVPTGTLEALVEQLEEPGVAATGCRLLFPDGTIQHAGVAFVRDQVLGGLPMGNHVLHKQDQGLAAGYASYEPDCVTAACMAIRADVFRAMGGFDERFVNGLEDVDLCLRIRHAGHRIVCRGDVTVIHHEGASRGRDAELWATPQARAVMTHNQTLLTGRWGGLLDPDDELAARVWDAELNSDRRPRDRGLADAVIVGQCGGIGPGADESRAFLALLSADGTMPGVIDEPWPSLRARMPHELRAALERGLRTPVPVGVPALHIPAGEYHRLELEPMAELAIYRLASPRTALALDQAAQVWATCPSVAEAIAAQGVARELILVMPPPLPARPPAGRGGAGALVVLPTHEPALARTLLEAIGRWETELALQILPTAHVRGFAKELAELLPGAELLGVCSEESRFAELAGAADVVGVFDPSDPFERRALVAAATGTPVVIARSDGPAAWVLDDLAGCATGTEDIPARLAELAGRERQARATQRERVIAACTRPPQPLMDGATGARPLIAIGEPRPSAAPFRRASVTVGPEVAPLVSVVIPACDDGRFLAGAIDSALRQVDPGGPLELIVVDDGSADETPAVIARYGERVRAVRQPQEGRFAAIDRGLALVRGRYVALLDAADQLPGGRLARQVKVLEANPEVGLVHGDVELIGEHGCTLVPSLRARDARRMFDGRVLGKLLADNFVVAGAATFRASLLPALRPIASEATDLDWWIAACIAAVAQLRLERGSANRRRDRGGKSSVHVDPGLDAERKRQLQRRELPWRRWMLRNLLRDDTITVPDMTAALASFSRSLQANDDATASADPVAAAEALATLPDAGAGAPRSRALLAELACDPFNASTLAALEHALATESHLDAPAPAPPLIALETRPHVTLAWLGEVLSEPALLRGYAAAGDEQRSLVILAPPQADLSPLESLFESDPALRSETCDAIVIAEPATVPATRLLCARASSRLTVGDPPSPYDRLPIDPAVERIVVRRRAPSAAATRR